MVESNQSADGRMSEFYTASEIVLQLSEAIITSRTILYIASENFYTISGRKWYSFLLRINLSNFYSDIDGA